MKTRKSTSSEVATNFCNPTTSFSTKNHSPVNGHCQCNLCDSATFSNYKQFIGHLKSVHCSISEGGSLVCRYGKNGVCPSLPLESFENDENYAEHVHRFHMNQNGVDCSPVRSHLDKISTDTNGFTVNSFTQNLSSVLSDPGRSRSEVASFFTRHWGEHFVPKTSIPLTAQLPKITDAHFLHYLSTTAKKHRQYLKARRALRKAISRHAEETTIDPEEVPTGQTPVEAAGGRLFRPYKPLHNRLEWYMDTIGILLNHQLECKSEEFWRTVNSYSVLHGELETAIEKARLVRKNLKITDQKIYEKSQKMVQLYHSKRNRELLLRKLNDIACLRDAQNTVQMLLNQNDFPKALECIETAQEVLNSDLKGVLCFRHLSNQLQELNKFIGKLLQEEFISLIQREFKSLLRKTLKVATKKVIKCYNQRQLHPVILGLLRCKEYRFITVLKSEVVEAVKNTVRQIVKGRIVECESNLADFDPSLGNLAEQITRMTLTQWVDTLSAVLRSLYLLCCRVMSIQELIMENLLFMEELRAKNRAASPKPPSLSANNSNNNDEQQSQNEFSESSSSAIHMLPRRTPSQASIHSVASALSLPIFASNHTAYDPDIHGPKGRYSKSEEVSLAAAEDSNDDGAETPTNDENIGSEMTYRPSFNEQYEMAF